jgi:hypothetical protein
VYEKMIQNCILKTERKKPIGKHVLRSEDNIASGDELDWI